MRLTRTKPVLLGLVFSGCLLPDVGLVESFGSGGAAANASSGANHASGNAPLGAGTSAGAEANSAGGEPDNAAGSGAGTDSAGGSDTGTAGGGQGNGGNAGTETSGSGGTGGTARPTHPHAWASWPMPNDASTTLPNPASYDTAMSGVVKDNVTGLMWQRTAPAGLMDHAAASEYCGNLTLAALSDWRLPTRIELISIMDHSVLPPAATIDPTAFPDTLAIQYWTASLYKRNSARPFVCDFAAGGVNVPGSTYNYAVRCVRP